MDIRVERVGDRVWLIFSDEDGEAMRLSMSPADAERLALQLVG